MPFLNVAYVHSGQSKAVLLCGITIVLACARIAGMTYSVNTIIIKDNAPNANSMGATNGLVQTAGCVSRAMSPAFVR